MATRVTVECDMRIAPTCVGLGDPYPTRKGARNAAYRAGWRREGRIDVCPECGKRAILKIRKD